ncbi:MAG: hypothetical protein JKY33_05510 [Bacteroidia bacterium]|nr:hypothetical protein [Bacteroidia bacterium]
MRKLFTVLMMMVVLGSAAIAQTTVLKSNEDVAVAKARAEVQSTCLAGTGDISSSVWQYQDGTYMVYFYHNYKCIPNTICPMYLRIAPLARVTLDADYNILQATCGFMWFELL